MLGLVELTQTKEGEPYVKKSRYGDNKTVQVGREWLVKLDGRTIGQVRYALITRERKPKGLTYVTARWQSPGWKFCGPNNYWFESTSRKSAIETLIWEDRNRGKDQ